MQKDAAKHRSGKVETIAAAGEAKVLTLWAGENIWLRHGDIVRQTSSLNKRTVERILLRLVKERVLEKMERGSASYYRKQQAPKDFEAVQYLRDLNSRLPEGMAYEFDVGGVFTHIAFGRLVGFPTWKEEDLREDEREILRLLTRRLGFIFQALWLLRNAMLIRRLGADVPINEEALLTYLFESIADLESRRSEAGIQERFRQTRAGTIQEKNAAIIKGNFPRHGELANIYTTVDFLLSDGTLDTFLDKTSKSKPKYYELTVPELLKKKEAIRRRENRYAASVQAGRKKSPRPLNQVLDEATSKAARSNPVSAISLSSILDAMIEIPSDLSNEEHQVDLMLAYRVAEALRSRGLKEVNELGVLVTAHPWTSNQFADDEQLVYSTMHDLVDLRAQKGIVKGTAEFAKEAGEGVAHYHSLDIDSVRALRRKPWFASFIGPHWREFADAFARERVEMRKESQDFMDRFFRRHKRPVNDDGKSGASA